MLYNQLANPKDLTIIQGNLRQCIEQSEPYSRQTAAELSWSRAQYAENPELAQKLAATLFYTANVSIFMKHGKTLLAGIGGRNAFNIVFGEDTAIATDELKSTGFYTLPEKKKTAINLWLSSGEVVFVDFKALGLKIDNQEYGHFTLRTSKYEKDVTQAREPFVRAFIGEGIVRQKVMNYLADNSIRKIDETNEYLPNPEKVEDALKELKDGDMIARACWLYNFNGLSCFDADGRSVDGRGALRGVRRVETAEGDEKKNPLEELVGKGAVAHDVAVVRQGDVTQEAWQLLTRKQ